MSRGLETLIKLQKTKVDDQRQIVSKLMGHLENIEQAIADLEQAYAHEQDAARQNPEAGLTLGAYVARALEKARSLGKSRETAIQAVDLARDQLALLFEEQKRYEIALENQRAAEVKEEQRKERIELDEVGSVRFQRQKKLR